MCKARMTLHMALRKNVGLMKYYPKAFNSNFCKKKGTRPSVNSAIFHYHFKELVSQTFPPLENNFRPKGQSVFDEIDCNVTESEISDAIKKFKKRKVTWTRFN